MSILIYANKPDAPQTLIAVAPDHLLSEVEAYCTRRNAGAKEAGYATTYGYERSAVVLIEFADDLT